MPGGGSRRGGDELAVTCESLSPRWITSSSWSGREPFVDPSRPPCSRKLFSTRAMPLLAPCAGAPPPNPRPKSSVAVLRIRLHRVAVRPSRPSCETRVPRWTWGRRVATRLGGVALRRAGLPSRAVVVAIPPSPRRELGSTGLSVIWLDGVAVPRGRCRDSAFAALRDGSTGLPSGSAGLPYPAVIVAIRLRRVATRPGGLQSGSTGWPSRRRRRRDPPSTRVATRLDGLAVRLGGVAIPCRCRCDLRLRRVAIRLDGVAIRLDGVAIRAGIVAICLRRVATRLGAATWLTGLLSGIAVLANRFAV